MKRLFLVLGVWGIAVLPAAAGGHLNTFNGVPVVYKPVIQGAALVIPYKIDQGLLGHFSDSTAQRMVRESFSVWEDVPTAAISFSDAGMLPVDVNGSNYTPYTSQFNDGINPVIFDHDGAIIDALLGDGSSNKALGVAASAYYNEGPNAGAYAEGYAIMNGVLAQHFTFEQFKATLVHEFGHFIGLDHSQINTQFVANRISSDDLYVPTMIPSSTDDDAYLASLNPDDIIAVSRLYPEPTFLATTGTISGKITRSDGTNVRGANVVAISTTDPLFYRVSTVSDYLELVNGEYSITGIEQGSYWIMMEPINPAFTGGSRVGPYASSSLDLSFRNPVATEYFNGANESDDPALDNPAERVAIIVASGDTVTASFVANREGASGTGTTLQDFGIPAYVFELPSEYSDTKYAVKFTPGIDGRLMKTDFLLRQSGAVEGNGVLNVSVHQNVPGSVGGVPGAQIGSTVTVPFSAFNSGVFNEVDLSSQNIMVYSGVHFHVVFEVVGTAGDTLSFVSDDAAVATNRSSSWYDAGVGFQWYNFSDALNYGIGYNLVVRAYLFTVTSVDGEEVLLPDVFVLGQNYPNPFNPATVIPFKLEQSGEVTLEVFDMLGRKIATLIERRTMKRGAHTASFRATELPSGIYVAVLKAGTNIASRRMVLTK